MKRAGLLALAGLCLSGLSGRTSAQVEMKAGVGLETRFATAQDAPLPDEIDHRGLSMLRATATVDLYAQLPGRAYGFASARGSYDARYDIQGRDEFTPDVKSEYADETEIREAWIAGETLPELDLKVGRQIVIWGYADFLRAVDVVNPLDRRDPGLLDLEDIRLPVTISRADYYWDKWSLNLNAIHEFEPDRNPPFGSEFYPFDDRLPAREQPASTLEDSGIGLALSRRGSNGDLSFYLADYHDPGISLTMDRTTMAGLAGQWIWEDWLFKGEAAYTDNLTFLAEPDRDVARTDWLVGCEYAAWDDTYIILELLYQNHHGFSDIAAGFPDLAIEEQAQATLYIRRSFLHERVNANLLAYASEEIGHFQRLWLAFDWFDGIATEVGFVHYENGNHPIAQDIRDNDKLFFRMEVTF